jgi:hypothetical protein
MEQTIAIVENNDKAVEDYAKFINGSKTDIDQTVFLTDTNKSSVCKAGFTFALTEGMWFHKKVRQIGKRAWANRLKALEYHNCIKKIETPCEGTTIYTVSTEN